MNKIGSTGLSLAARRAGATVHVLADLTKILPTGFPQILEDDRPASEVWDGPEGVAVWNRYFEVTPLDLVDSVVTETGVLSVEELERLREGIELPAGLRAWAVGRMEST